MSELKPRTLVCGRSKDVFNSEHFIIKDDEISQKLRF